MLVILALLLLLQLLMVLVHEFFDFLVLFGAMARTVVHRAMRTAVITAGCLAGTLVTPRAPTPTHRCSSRSGRGAGQWLTVATSLLLACLLLPPPPWAAAPVLGWSHFPASGIGGACQAQPSAALTHLSARLKSSATSLMSCVASFFNIFSSLTP
jgi:hypothetical protein